jgi:Terpene synthase family 2, C-terminal metal binding
MGLRMPELRTPFPVVVNAYVDRIDDPTREWVQHWRLLTTAEQADRYYGRLMCGYATAATNPELGYAELCLANDWNMWLFLQDDFWGNYPDSEEQEATALGMLPRLVAVIMQKDPDPRAETHGLVASFADLWRRTASRTSADQLGRLREAAHSTLMAILWEAQIARIGCPISLPQYRPMRVLSAFPVFVLRLEEILGGYAIPVTQIRDPRVERLVWLSAATTCWLNDVISYPKESRTEQSNAFSIPEILHRQDGSPPQQALDTAAEAFYQSIRDYQRQEDEVLQFADPELRRYIELATRPFISGWTDWAYRTGRYGVGMPMDAAPLSLSARGL